MTASLRTLTNGSRDFRAGKIIFNNKQHLFQYNGNCNGDVDLYESTVQTKHVFGIMRFTEFFFWTEKKTVWLVKVIDINCILRSVLQYWCNLWPLDTNTNIIRFPKNDRIRILFGFPKMTEYEYEYYSISQKWPNTNTNIIRFPKNDRIRILFGYPQMTEYEYEYHSPS